MFSANENMALRQHKRRIIQYVEETMSEDLLDEGVTVLAMQVSCRAPGCVPLETVITIIFPPSSDELLPGLPESKTGKFTTKVLMPMSDITKDDILEALPPAFEGGRQTMESLCLRARDVMLAQITQLCTSVESKRVMAQYLQECLGEYVENDFEAPEYREPFPVNESKSDKNEIGMRVLSNRTADILIGRGVDKDEAGVSKKDNNPGDQKQAAATFSTFNSSDTKPAHRGSSGSTHQRMRPSANDWRRQQSVARTFKSDSLLLRVEKMEHATGIGTPGCLCCDPDDPKNFLDNMMM